MSTRQVVGPVIVGRISPASVWMLNVSASVQPLLLRYRIASRAPLPESSASLPSGLKILQAGDVARLVGLGEDQDAVRARPEVRVAEPLDRARGQLAPPRR